MKVFCIGRNYVDHAKELNNPVPSQPMVFMKPDTAVVKDQKAFYYPEFSTNIHFECEVVLRVSKAGKSISEDNALDYIDQVTLGLDFTARDLQSELKAKGHPWEIAKSFDYSAPIGEFRNFDNWRDSPVKFRLEKNGKTVQIGNSSNLIFPFTRLVSHLSQYFTLKVGDLIFTGTPAGVGQIEKGDIFEGFLEEEKVLVSIIK